MGRVVFWLLPDRVATVTLYQKVEVFKYVVCFQRSATEADILQRQTGFVDGTSEKTFRFSRVELTNRSPKCHIMIEFSTTS